MTQGVEPAEILRRYHAAINALDYHAIEAMFAADIVYDSGGVGGLISGRDAVMAAFKTYFAEYPDQVSEDLSVETLSPNTARSVWALQATSATTGAPYKRQGTETITLDEDGRIIRVDVEG
ncbi:MULTISPECIES: nuclear transport factor 2 family protein [unclassified Mesorhizobium]|uniref:nuclear transport factor 2 family protein n=1 Tax=unclassified Mesorhizobium TaxID=325217 RepID=UPI0008E8FAB3|nr:MULTISPECIES: nuclear transport factor 2 family protein [unclassified Mesorhizobium]RJG45974.1 nuclear transport factor 2 family protein [Mesorhizobium sp. DCY119]SFT95612.1 SnoaL-like domain-containing protein [Mesorhizobium sp. YR577]